MALTMRDMPFQPVVVPWSLQFTSVKAICNVAGVGAIFPGAVFADTKCLSAMAAGGLSVTTMLDQFRVSIPPFGSASIGTENSAFPSGSLNQNRSAAPTRFFRTVGLVRNCTAQVVSFAVGFYRIHGQSHQLPNLFIAKPLLAVSRQHPFFISSHIISSIPRVFLNDPSGQEC